LQRCSGGPSSTVRWRPGASPSPGWWWASSLWRAVRRGDYVALASLLGLAVMAYRTELFAFGTKFDVVATLGLGLAGVIAVTPLLIAGSFAAAMVLLGAVMLFMLLAIASVWFLRQVFRR